MLSPCYAHKLKNTPCRFDERKKKLYANFILIKIHTFSQVNYFENMQGIFTSFETVDT